MSCICARRNCSAPDGGAGRVDRIRPGFVARCAARRNGMTRNRCAMAAARRRNGTAERAAAPRTNFCFKHASRKRANRYGKCRQDANRRAETRNNAAPPRTFCMDRAFHDHVSRDEIRSRTRFENVSRAQRVFSSHPLEHDGCRYWMSVNRRKTVKIDKVCSRPHGAPAVVFSDMRRESHVGLRRIYRFLPRVRIAGRCSISSVFSRMNQLRFAAAGAHVRNDSDVGRAGPAEPVVARFDSRFFRVREGCRTGCGRGFAGAEMYIGRDMRRCSSQV